MRKRSILAKLKVSETLSHTEMEGGVLRSDCGSQFKSPFKNENEFESNYSAIELTEKNLK